ncbi:hypothetical protein HDU85_005630 [Gaertneriomyces sp. JEL0708]|nr:hypothetical protein HDU85_005630 [Gaertneriomyces sp. JEL0708]
MVTRQMEMINVLIGYEEANKYALKDATGTDVGFIAEEETSFSGMLSRQLLRTRRPFKAVVLDRNGNVVLKISRPMKWLLNSKIFVHDADDRLIGEVQQVWHLLRRKYDLFLKTTQHSLVDAPFLSWDFNLMNETDQVLATVNRNFTGFAREIFTDFGQYAVHFDDTSPTALSLDERALILACAINIDIDYFSRHSHGGGGLLHGFMPFPMMGGSHHEAGNVPAPSPVGGDMVGTMGTVGAVGGGAGVAGDIAAVGAGAVAGQAIGGVMGGGRAAPDMGGQNMPPPPPSTAPADQTNQWGDSPFLSDEDAGVSTSEGGGGGGGWGDMMRDFFED